MAFAPKHVPNFDRKILSTYVSNIVLNQGQMVDIDATDTTLINGSLGSSALSSGGLVLATVGPQSSTVFGRELGMALVNVTTSGPSIIDRILEIATNYMTLPEGIGTPVFIPSPGDIVATDQYWGGQTGETGSTGYLNIALQANLGKPVGVYQGRFRLVQNGTDAPRARYLGQTTISGAAAGLFQFC